MSTALNVDLPRIQESMRVINAPGGGTFHRAVLVLLDAVGQLQDYCDGLTDQVSTAELPALRSRLRRVHLGSSAVLLAAEAYMYGGFWLGLRARIAVRRVQQRPAEPKVT
jgi:hypothetical protein